MLIRRLTRFSPRMTIHRRRFLARPGRILARKGQRVGADDVVAETNCDPKWTLIDVGRALGLTPERSPGFIRRSVGEVLARGDLLAQGPSGYAQRSVYAPASGRVLWTGEGRILLESSENICPLKAVYPGQVCELIADRGVEIESRGGLIQGVWGNGRVNHGNLAILEGSLKRPLDAGDFDPAMKGKVLLGGFCGQANVLDAAASLGIAGLILASMPAKLIPEALHVPYAILLIQGFGPLPWIDDGLTILFDALDREIILNALRCDPDHSERPEVFIPSGEADPDETGGLMPAETWTPFFAPGQRVRMIMAPYMGRSGTIHNITSHPQGLENGLSDFTAEVILDDRERIVVPIANLDVLE